MKININDPRITQYALDEMPVEEKQAFEKEINNNPEILKEIEDIKQFSSVLEVGFDADPELSLSDTRKRLVKVHTKNQKAPSSNNRVFLKVFLSAAATFTVAFIVLTMVTGTNPISEILGSSKSNEMNFHDLTLTKRQADYKPKFKMPENETEEDVTLAPRVEEEMREMPRQLTPEKPRTTEKQSKKMDFSRLAASRMTAHKSSPQVAKKRKQRELLLTKSNKIMFVDGHVKGYAGTVAACDTKKERTLSFNHTQGFNTENYSQINENQFKKVLDHPLSTFSIDVDTASYSNMRRFINQGSLPPVDAVRIEELINYFNYEYPQPDEKPFAVNFEMATSPWNPRNRLVKIGLKGKEIAQDKRPSSNLVFLLDVSGSMGSRNKLPLLKQSIKLLLEQLDEKDRVAIVVYAGASGLALPSTTADKKEKILGALERLSSGGSTNGGAGIQLAYKIAIANFIKGGVNRVILATDGDFNVGITGEGALERLIEKSAKSGVFLSVLGFGMGNYKDSNLEKLSGKGNGNYAYIDTLNEAKKVLVNEMGSTLITIAKDVKIQVEFNPALVEGYRLIGYENRMLKKEDFNDDKKDAGEIGAGHTVTAFYEIVPKGNALVTPEVDPLKYQKNKKTKVPESEFSNEVMTVKLRYKEPDGSISKLLTFPLKNNFKEFGATSDDFKFAAAVVEFGMLLRNSRYKGDATFKSALDLARKGLRNDEFGYKKEFITLIEKAEKLKSVRE